MQKIFLRYTKFQPDLNNYLNLDEFQTLSPLTVGKKRSNLTSLLNYLGDNDIHELCDCEQRNVTAHLCNISNLSTSTISGRCFIFRHFFNYLYHEGIIPYSSNELFPVIFTNKRDRILSFYSSKEVRKRSIGSFQT